MDLFKNKKGIYLDYAATTPVSKSVHAAMEPYFSDVFANPSSLHLMGQHARAVVDEARERVSGILGCSWKEIIFTASATESINLAFRGIIKAARAEPGSQQHPLHIITTNIEHSAVMETAKDLEREGVEVTYLPVNSEGLVGAQQVAEAIKENTVLVSVMYVNNEIGTIQPIVEIADAISQIRSKLQTTAAGGAPLEAVVANGKGNKPFATSHLPYFHTDAVQAANYLDINIKNLGVDLMTLSGHKIYGPKGVGILYKKEGTHIAPVITGGEHERGLRAGTENVPSIMGFAAALGDVEKEKEEEGERVKKLRDYFIERVLAASAGISLNGSPEYRVANNVNFCFKNKSTETLIPALDEKGIYASGGSACTSRTPEPSHVIAALGNSKCAASSIRFTFGRTTTRENIERAVDAIIKLGDKN